MKSACVAVILCEALLSVEGQPSNGYAEYSTRQIKALSTQQVDDLLEGRGMGLSLPAELNGVPGPRHVLELRDRLALTWKQVSDIERLAGEMKQEAQRLGQSIVSAERDLDRTFKEQSADEASIRLATAKLASLNGDLRALHLGAHIKTRRFLTDAQISAYDAARGYAMPATMEVHDHATHLH
jgi:hypothetical protein